MSQVEALRMKPDHFEDSSKKKCSRKAQICFSSVRFLDEKDGVTDIYYFCIKSDLGEFPGRSGNVD